MECGVCGGFDGAEFGGTGDALGLELGSLVTYTVGEDPDFASQSSSPLTSLAIVPECQVPTSNTTRETLNSVSFFTLIPFSPIPPGTLDDILDDIWDDLFCCRVRRKRCEFLYESPPTPNSAFRICAYNCRGYGAPATFP